MRLRVQEQVCATYTRYNRERNLFNARTGKQSISFCLFSIYVLLLLLLLFFFFFSKLLYLSPPRAFQRSLFEAGKFTTSQVQYTSEVNYIWCIRAPHLSYISFPISTFLFPMGKPGDLPSTTSIHICTHTHIILFVIFVYIYIYITHVNSNILCLSAFTCVSC